MVHRVILSLNEIAVSDDRLFKDFKHDVFEASLVEKIRVSVFIPESMDWPIPNEPIQAVKMGEKFLTFLIFLNLKVEFDLSFCHRGSVVHQ